MAADFLRTVTFSSSDFLYREVIHELPYVIQNTHSGSYMCYDLNHRLSATSNVRKAESFEDSGKAYNVLMHCYPKSQRPDWQVVELPREAAKPDPEQAVRCSDMEANVRGSLRHVVSWPEVSDTLQQIYSEIFAYRAELQDALVRVESELCDCEHACEFFKFDAAKGYRLYRMIRACRINRRFLKDELRRVSAAVETGAVETASGRLQKTMHDIDTQVYTPRVLKELFNG